MRRRKTNKERPYGHAEEVRLVYSGVDYFQRLEKIIMDSTQELHIQTYIFDNDETGKRVIFLLKKAAARKVNIYILLDGFGASSFPKTMFEELRALGIRIRFFAPFFSTNTFYLGRRMHHKIVVADNKVALIGGINIADKYHGNAQHIPWLDYAVEVRGEICAGVQEFCSNIYQKRSFRTIRFTEPDKLIGEVPVRISLNDWVSQKNEIGKGYLEAIRNAKTEIIVVGGYFIPGRRLRTELKQAVQRGVKVKIILAGISDLVMVARATRFFYAFLLRNRIELYEWRQSILHGKAAVVDGEWCTIGSFNLNHLSTYASIEMNVEIKSKEFSEIFSRHLYRVISRCHEVPPIKHDKEYTLINRFLNWLSFRFIRAMSFVLTVFSYHRWFRRYFLGPK